MRATKLACRHCGRDRVDHCTEHCGGCWHWGVTRQGERALGCLIHDDLRIVAPFRWTTWAVAV